MAEKTQTAKLEREYVIPLRSEWVKVANYKRSFKAVKAIKEFIAKHMKVVDRDVNKVKLDIYLNNAIWAQGKSSPPSKIKVKAVKEGDEVKVTFAEIPQYVKFAKARHDKFNSVSEKSKKTEKVEEPKADAEVTAEKAEEKKTEVEKEKSTEIQHAKEAKVQENVQKHTTKVEKTIHPFRQALKK